MKKVRNILIVTIASVLLVSCFGDEPETEFEVFTDAYVLKKNTEGSPMYAVALFAYGNNLINSVTVTEMGGLGEVIKLTQNPASLYTMSKNIVNADYLPYPPASSDYKFYVTAESGETKEQYDFLRYDDLDIPDITSTEFIENKKLFKIEWRDVDGIDGFIIKIINSKGVLAYNEGVESDITNLTIDVIMGNWIVFPEQGETCTIQVHAFAYEPDIKEDVRVYNIQEVSLSEVSVVWE